MQAWKKCRSRDLGSDKTADFGIKFEFQKKEGGKRRKKEKGEKEKRLQREREKRLQRLASFHVIVDHFH